MANEYRISQFAVEALHTGAPAAHVSQFAVEALHTGAPSAGVSSFSLEILRSISEVPFEPEPDPATASGQLFIGQRLGI